MMKSPIFSPFVSIISKYSILILIGLFFLPICSFGDERSENIDVFLVLDKSLSMVEEIDAVTDYVDTELVEKTLIPGDFFLVLQFYGQAELLLAKEVGAAGLSQDELGRRIKQVAADGHFTDIGNALDTLQETLKEYDDRERRKFLLLITDGKQEAPPESKYYSPDGRFNHQFLENSKVIEKEGWKIHILGIGAGSAAKELAETLSGTYTEVEEEPTPEEIARETKDLLGSILVQGTPQVKAFSRRGRSTLTLNLESRGYDEAKTISLRRLFIDLEGREIALAEDIELIVPPSEEQPYTIALTYEGDEPVGSGMVEMGVDFGDGPVFTPARFSANVAPKSFFGRYWPYLVAALLALLLILLILFLISRGLFAGKTIRLTVEYENGDPAKQISIKRGESLFVAEGIKGIDVAPRKTGDLLAVLRSEGDEILIDPENKDVLLGGSISGNILGKTLKFRDRYGKFRGITISRSV